MILPFLIKVNPEGNPYKSFHHKQSKTASGPVSIFTIFSNKLMTTIQLFPTEGQTESETGQQQTEGSSFSMEDPKKRSAADLFYFIHFLRFCTNKQIYILLQRVLHLEANISNELKVGRAMFSHKMRKRCSFRKFEKKCNFGKNEKKMQFWKNDKRWGEENGQFHDEWENGVVSGKMRRRCSFRKNEKTVQCQEKWEKGAVLEEEKMRKKGAVLEKW